MQDQHAKSAVFLYPSNEQCENKIHGLIPFIIRSKNLKYGINLINFKIYTWRAIEYTVVS